MKVKAHRVMYTLEGSDELIVHPAILGASTCIEALNSALKEDGVVDVIGTASITKVKAVQIMEIEVEAIDEKA